MNHTLVNVSVPFFIEFVRRRCRNAESEIFWEDGTIAIRTVTAQQAPAVCHVCSGEKVAKREFAVRSFEGKLWWPLFDGLRPLSVANYVGNAAQSDGPFLSMMNLSPATIHSHPRRNAEHFFEQIFARLVDGPSREERWRSPQRIAHRTLFCDDVVYIEGGRPLYFGIRCGTPDTPMLSLDIGGAEVEQIHLVSRYLPGPRPNERRDAACRLLVYGMERIEDEVDLLRRRGLQVTFASRAQGGAGLRSHRDACEICADALVRRAVTAMGPPPFEGLESRLQRQLQAAALSPHKILPELCREAIYAMAATCHEDAFFGRFGVEFEHAAEALSQLDAMHAPILSELDDQALVAISNLALRA